MLQKHHYVPAWESVRKVYVRIARETFTDFVLQHLVYFETARAISSITASKTITKFPNLRWRVSHGAGAFPDISERFLLGFPDVAEEARKIYRERFWYDSAGPVFPNQVKGLTEGMKIPISQMVFGTVGIHCAL